MTNFDLELLKANKITIPSNFKMQSKTAWFQQMKCIMTNIVTIKSWYLKKNKDIKDNTVCFANSDFVRTKEVLLQVRHGNWFNPRPGPLTESPVIHLGSEGQNMVVVFSYNATYDSNIFISSEIWNTNKEQITLESSGRVTFLCNFSCNSQEPCSTFICLLCKINPPKSLSLPYVQMFLSPK